MISVGLLAASVVGILCTIDALVAEGIRAEGCPHCRGPLYAAFYTRKTRGLSDDDGLVGPTKRWSWCCGRCRKRLTTPSVLFLGQKVYAAPIIAALQCTPAHTPSERHLREESGCSRQSVRRWRAFFHDLWERPVGRAIRHLFSLHPDERRDPTRVLRCWPGRWPHLVVRWQLMLHPITGGRHWPPGARWEPLNAQKMDFASILEDLQDPHVTF